MVGIAGGALMIGSRGLFASGLLLALGSFAMGQTQAPSTRTGESGTAATGPRPAMFHTGANLVVVDVVVRDKGRVVPDLKASDFEVLEDEKPQAVTTFEEHKATDAVEVSAPPHLPPHVYGDFPQYSRTSAANVLLLDALNTPMQDQKFVRQRMLRYVHAIPPGTQIAVFTLASRLRMVSGFTTDVGRIERALSQGHTPVEKSALADPEDDKAERDVTEAMHGAALDDQAAYIARSIQEFEDDRQAFQTQQQAEITIAALTEMGRYLSRIPGRKNLIWFSRGFPIRFTVDELRQDQDYSKRLKAMETLLAQARVAVYPVDAGGLMTLEDASLANVTAPTESGSLVQDLGTAVNEGMRNDITTPQQWGNEQAAMKDVAAGTGGEAFVNTNDAGRALQKAIADGSNYYTLSYAPPAAKDDGAWHAIRVRLVEGRYDLAYRRGYFDADSNQPGQPKGANPMTAAMEPGVPPLSQVIFEARVLPAGDPALGDLKPAPGVAGKPAAPLKSPVTRYFVDYAIAPRELVMKDLPDGRKQAELEITQELYDGVGKQVNSTDAGLEVTLTAAQMARDMRSGVRVRQEIDVPAENVSLRLGVRDASSGKIGTVDVPVGAERGNRE